MNPFIDGRFTQYYRAFPLTLVDVGAAGGLKHRWLSAGKFLRVIAFEPDDRAVVPVDQPEITVIRTALLDEAREAEFYLTKHQGCSSFLPPNQQTLEPFSEAKAFQVSSRKKMAVDTMDRQLAARGLVDVDFIKLDTQGTELQVLKGSETTLRRAPVFGLQIEVEFVEIYQGQSLFPDVDNFVRERGFQLFDIRTCYWKRAVAQAVGGPKGQLIWGDALYLRGLEEFFTDIERLEEPDHKTAKALKAISVCLLYGYLDYAVETARTAKSHGIVDEDELETIERLIMTQVPFSNRLPRIRGRGRLASLFYRLYDALRPERADAVHTGRFSNSDRFLGNRL